MKEIHILTESTMVINEKGRPTSGELTVYPGETIVILDGEIDTPLITEALEVFAEEIETSHPRESKQSLALLEEFTHHPLTP